MLSDININKYRQAYRRIQAASNILLVTHERPDGDALASLCSLIELVESLNKKYVAYCQDEPTHNFSFLPHIEKIISLVQIGKINFSEFDLIIVLDCGSLDRTGLVKEIKTRVLNQFVIEFDHHPKNDDYADLEIRIPTAVSTTEILFHFLKTNRIRITKNTANCILTGLLGDSGNFLYPVTSGGAVNIASEMLVYGAQFSLIVKNILYNKSLSAMKLWGLVLNNLQINSKYNLAFSTLTLEEIGRFDNSEDVFDSISGFLSNLYGVKAVLFLREEKNDLTSIIQIKGSLRSSHPHIDVSKLAKIFGGGGHAKASGFVIDGRLEKNKNGWRLV